MKNSKRFKLSPLFLSITSFFPIYVEAEVIIDDKRSGSTSLNSAANGVPVIDINNPDNHGVSHNKYTDFNVGKEGIIFNNSTAEGVSKIGGFVINNPNLQNEASAIINEVTGAKGTQLNGTMEIFGRKADLIIANENGITVNGLSTLNTNNLTLSTGNVHRGADGSILLSVDRGNISIEGLGVNTAGVSYFDLISRTAMLTGEINGQADLKIVTGKNDYNLKNREHRVRTDTAENTPSVAISASQLGSMYGNRIQLISTESGAGVRHEGSIIGSNSIEITANGDVHLTSLVTEKGGLKVTGKSIVLDKNESANLGGISASNDIILQALTHIELGADIVSQQGIITINANDLLQSSAKLLAGNGIKTRTSIPGIKINVANKYLLTGNLYAMDSHGKKLENAIVSLENGDYVVKLNGKKIEGATVFSDASVSAIDKNIEINAGNFTNQNGLISTRNGTLEINIKDSILNNGVVQANGSLVIQGKNLKNTGVVNTTENLNFTLGSLENSGALYANGIDIKSSGLKNSGIILTEKGDLSIRDSGKDGVNNSGLLQGNNNKISSSGSLINDGTIRASSNLDITASSVKNTKEITSGNGIDISVEKGLFNSGASAIISADKSISVVKNNKNVTASFENNDNAILQSGDTLLINNINNISNSGLIIAKGNTTIKNGDSLVNNKGQLQGGTINIEKITTIDSKNGSGITASDNITIRDVSSLTNDNSSISSYKNILLENLNSLTNNISKIEAEYDITLKKIDKVNNKLSSVTSSSGAIFIDSVRTLNNTLGSTISAASKLTIKDADEVKNSADSTLQSTNNIEIQNVQNIKNIGLILSEVDLIIKDVNVLVNSGDAAVIQAANILFENIKDITNEDVASILAKDTIDLNKIESLLNKLSALIQATKVNIKAGTINNQDYSSYIISDDEMRINADNVINTNEAAILSNNTLSINANNIKNGENSDINSQQYTIQSAKLENNGVISSQDYTSVDSIKADLFDNKSGRVLSDGSLSIHTKDFLSDDDSYILGAKNLSLNLNKDFDNLHAGRLASNGMLDITTSGTININKTIESFGSIKLTGSDIYNNAALVSMNNIYLNAASIVNDVNSLLFSIKNIFIDANKTLINQPGGNILSQGDLTIKSGVVQNLAGTMRAEGDIIFDVDRLDNLSSYKNESWDTASFEFGRGSWVYEEFAYAEKFFANLNLPTLVSDISLDKKAEISSGGDIYFNTSRQDKPLATLNNRGGLIQAKKNINIYGNVKNITGNLEINYFDMLNLSGDSKITLSFEHYKLAWDNSGSLYFDNMFEVLNYIYGQGGRYTTSGGSMSIGAAPEKFGRTLIELSSRNSRLNQIMKSLFGEHWRTDSHSSLTSKWSDLSANSYQKLKDKKYYFLPEDKAEISSGGNIAINGGRINNGIDIALNGNVKQLNNIVDVNIDDIEISTLEQGYEVSFSKKKLEEIKQGISVLPTLEDLVVIKGIFQTSQAFLDFKNSEIYSADRKDSFIIPMYETRIEMIDMSHYYGSDYFFDKVGYQPEKPVIVIGDNYFTNELVRRQISTSLGAALSIKYGIEGTDLIKTLYDNTGLMVNSVDSNFEVGVGLSPDQIANLTQDVIWFVTESIDGIDVLVPKLYLANSTIESLSENNVSGGTTLHAGGNMSLNVEELHNYNGAISGGGNVVIQATGDVNNSSSGMSAGISAGGTVLINSAQGDINNSGAYIKAGDTVSLTAGSGDVNIISSVGRDGNGDQVIGLYDDGIFAEKNVNISAENVNITAVDISTGDDPTALVNLTSTDGNVVFNDIHELNSTNQHSSVKESFLSSRTVDEIDITAQSKTSSINTNGNLIINSSNDVVFSGGEYNAGSASISADNNVIVKTSQDHHKHEKTITETDFVIDLSVDLPGMPKKGLSYSNLDGVSHADTNVYESGGSNPNLNTASAKRPGAAPTADTASAKLGIQNTESKTTESSTKNTNTQFNFTNGALINAGEIADIGGMDLAVSENAAASIIAGDVQSTKYNDIYTKTDSYKETFAGIKAEGHSVLIDSANKYANLANKSDKQDMDVDALRTTGQVVGDISNIVFNDLAGSSVKIGWSELNSHETKTTSSENKNSISGGQINIMSEKDIVLHGTDLNAVQVNMNTAGDLLIKAAESTETSSSSRSTHDAGVSLSGGVAATGAGIGVSLDYSGSVSSGMSDSKSYANAKVVAQQVNINSGNDVTLAGANILASEANMNVGGNLTIESKQDTSLREASSESWAASVGASVSTSGLLPNVSANYGNGGERHDSALTNEQSGITTVNSVNIHTQGDLTMSGGHIVSSTGAGNINVEGDVNTTVVKDHIDSEGMYQGGGGGIGYKGQPTANYYNDTLDEIHMKADQNNTINVSNQVGGQIQGAINTDIDKAVVITEDKKKAGNNISVTVSVPLPTSKKGSYDVNNDNLTDKTATNDGVKNPSTSSTSNSDQGQSTTMAPPQQSSTPSAQSATSTSSSNTEYSSISHDAIQGQRPTMTDSPLQQATVTNRPSGVEGLGTPNNSSSTPTTGSVTSNNGKWPTVTPSSGYIGGTGSSSRPDGMNSGKTMLTNQNSQSTPPVATNGGSSTSTQGSTSSSSTSKWPTVTPSSGYIGGTGSSSRPDGMNSGKTMLNNQNSQSTPSVATNGGSSTSTQGSTSSSSTGKWPTVTPSSGYIGGTGSSSRPDGMNTGGTRSLNRDGQSTHSSANKGSSVSNTTSAGSSQNTPEYRATSSKQKIPSQTYDGKKWPTVTESKGIIGGSGSSSRLDGMNSGVVKPVNNTNKVDTK